MKLAIIADIHGNYKALEAFLTYIETNPVDGILCLGDYVTDSPYTERVLELVYKMQKQYTCYMVRGNREQYMIDNRYHDRGFHPSSPSGILDYTAKHLTKEDLDFFESLPESMALQLTGCPSICICHGSPDDLRGNFYEQPELLEPVMKNLKEEYLFGGHSHNQGIDHFYGKTYVNPGALGMDIGGKGYEAPFAIACTVNSNGKEEFEIEFKRIPYDLESFLQDFTTSGLDECGMMLAKAVKKTLQTGINYSYNLVTEVEKISLKPAFITEEEVWEKAAKKLNL